MILALTTTGCATLGSATQTVRVVTEPPGAQVAVLDHGGRQELGAAPVEYRKGYEAYRCSPLAWLLPAATVAVSGGAGFWLAYGTTARNDKLDSAWAAGSLFGAVGLALGIALTAECRMKDGVVPGHEDAQVVVEAFKDGFQSTSAPVQVPGLVKDLKLVLAPLAAPPVAADVVK
ncbi:MAG: hypothetical protein HY901_37545 [Deltaproteobacteria bacterium]|nr:hypothetical protein [Deltaproteobacteria bacterium]